MTITSKAALAAELGISKARVSQYLAAGMPIRSDGNLDREKAVKWIADHHADYTGANKGVGRARALSAERRRPISSGHASGNGSSGRPPLPFYLAALERCENDFDRGVIAMALHVAYSAPARLAALAAVEGASMEVAFRFKGSTTCVLVDLISEFCRACAIGPFADSKDPDIYAPAAFHTVNWAALAKEVGEPLDVEGWEEAMRERRAAGLR